MEEPLKLISLMSENEDFIFESIAHYIKKQMRIPVQVINQIPWQEREKLLDTGQVDIAWICGFPYILRVDRREPGIEILASPVMSGNRYQGRPIYFSDIVVHRDSRFQAFADLKGASWAYNEKYSHSGYNVVRYHLATLGENGEYFSKVTESGAHLNSLQMILRKEVDASAIDSIVLEIELQSRPEICSKLRIIETLGPGPIPPLVISRKLPRDKKEALRQLLMQMENNPSGNNILTKIGLKRLVTVKDSDYDPIRYMYRRGRNIML